MKIIIYILVLISFTKHYRPFVYRYFILKTPNKYIYKKKIIKYRN